jgi:hypothetical protein
MSARHAGSLVLLLAVTVGCTAGGPGPSASPAAATPSAEAEGVALDLPTGWRTARPYQPPQIPDPLVRLAVASTPVRVAARGCHVASYRIPARGAMVVVLEWRHRELQPRGPLRRPADVRLADLHLRAPGPGVLCGTRRRG